ncbi:MAG: hypothetical protein ABIT61_10920 [Steroidobacteraceae bacterium]
MYMGLRLSCAANASTAGTRLLLLPFAWRHLKTDWPLIMQSRGILLFLGIGAFNPVLYSGLQTTTALNAMLLQAAQPAFVHVWEVHSGRLIVPQTESWLVQRQPDSS